MIAEGLAIEGSGLVSEETTEDAIAGTVLKSCDDICGEIGTRRRRVMCELLSSLTIE